ncbi:LysR family transcriptional regulator [Sphingomonas sp. SUN039]|uniref:LysR family transcriptional regulator n=1 Tax=Sphingomonas sp. SUN039 TaxID=2937787 RepID=UPI00216483BC|nr:LysR family transcriptional regulator [Sphingomonas sp. SUN039]UVO53403.1 LysR family transcriptional regulator [Sphingomonas sp. SUN039]
MQPDALNLRHLAALAATARLGSLSAAAQAVSLTQPALTQGLAKLERQFDEPLFERHPGGMVATAAVQVLAPRIEAALAHIASPRVTMAQMRALVALADAGSYPGASAATGLSQPTLHRAVADLSIGLRRLLVERRGKGIAFTEAGRRTVRAFRLARAELVAGLSEVAALRGQETGRITIGAMPLSRARLLPAAVTAFHRTHPHVEIRIVEGSHAELIEPLRDGEIDLLIGALRAPSPGDDVSQVPLFEDQPVVIARSGHPLAKTDDVTPGLLAAYPWTISAPGTPLRLLWERMFEREHVPLPPVPVECGSVITIRQILLDSDFLTLLSPDQIAVELEAGWLTQIGDPPAALRRTIGTTTRIGWRPTGMQQHFLDALTKLVAG